MSLTGDSGDGTNTNKETPASCKLSRRTKTLEVAQFKDEYVMKAVEEATDTKLMSKTFKVVLLGTSGVGKTSILRRFVEDRHVGDTLPTIGAEFISHCVSLYNGVITNLDIWDTAGNIPYVG
mmetsp:Transcript_11036/g.15293  ORF Transcript_11036/g.15293 Transcript_11036/m.15293 type:complete len:122 (-) Transcript_11036:640-1005(-)